METNHSSFNIKRISNILTGIGTLIVALTFVFLVFNGKKKEKERELLEQKNLELQRILADNTYKKDSCEIMAIIDSLILYTNTKQIDNYVSMFADTVERYFLVENVNKQFITKDVTKYWKRWQNFKYKYNKDQTIIPRADSIGNYKTIIYGVHCLDSLNTQNILSEIRFNKQKRIFYMRDFIDEKTD